MKHSTTRISPAKVNNLSGKAPVKSPSLRSKDLSISDCFTNYFLKNLFSNLYYPMYICAILTKVTKNTRAEIEGMTPKCAIRQHLVLNKLHTANFYLFDVSQDRMAQLI